MDETHTWSQARLEEHIRNASRLRMQREERLVYDALAEWLPRRLLWLRDNPRWLRLYLRLPHRTRPVLEYQSGLPTRIAFR